MIQILWRIATRSPRQVICAPNSYSLSVQRKEFFCWKPTYQIIGTNNPMRSDEILEAQETVPAEGNRGCSPSVQSTPDIEKKYVHRVYDAIAPHFSSTRFAKWPKVAGFLNSLRPGSVILDAGCGNGKYLGFNPDCFYIGCDISPPLIEICARRGHEVLVADAVNLPYRENFGDAAISIAVLHHLSTEDRRRKAIEELIRVVQRGGLVLITVWAVEQEDKSLLNKWTPLCQKYNEEWVDPSSPPVRNQSTTVLESIDESDEDTGIVKQTDDQLKISYNGLEDKTIVACSSSLSIDENDKTQQEYFVPWHLPFHRAEISGASAAALENGFAKKDDKKGAVVYNRYYHVFVEGELQRWSILTLNIHMKKLLCVSSLFHEPAQVKILSRTLYFLIIIVEMPYKLPISWCYFENFCCCARDIGVQHTQAISACLFGHINNGVTKWEMPVLQAIDDIDIFNYTVVLLLNISRLEILHKGCL